MSPRLLLLVFLAAFGRLSAEPLTLTLPGSGPGAPHVVLLSGDEEYRSEEALPMLAKILSERHGFRCTVLFALDPDGTINPDNQRSLPGAEALDTADAIVMALRFRNWPEPEMKRFVDAYRRGVPIVALRTSTHAFRIPDGPYAAFTEFGKDVLGERWVSHWGRHKVEAMLTVPEPGADGHPVMRGVGEIFADSDTYEAYPPADATILLRGRVLTGMQPEDPPATYRKRRATDKVEQAVNDPMMPVAWVRRHRNDAGTENRVLTTTMGAATDLADEDLRRLVVNGVYWGLGREVPARADVRPVDPYYPRMYGFKTYRRGLRPSDHALGRILPDGDPAGGAPVPEPPAAAAVVGEPVTLGPGARLALIGGGLADRMQHHGWLETMLQALHPNHRLVVRNLAVAGDEVVTRARSQDFGTPDEWLTRVGAGVVLAFFGFNESFGGEPGLAAFRADLARFLEETRTKRYDGVAPPRIILFSPIAHEELPDPARAPAPQNNRHLALYTAAMADVARDRAGVTFVNLFEASKRLYAEARREGRTLTHNGIHLTEDGEARLAPVILEAAFGLRPPAGDWSRLRAAVNEKNAVWHSRYRTVDGYNVYGGRSKLAFPSGTPGQTITNFQVMQEEMAQRDVMTANRDLRVWAVAQGADLAVKDDNLPPVTPVPTNKPGPKPDGTHVFLDGEEAIARMTVAPGLKVNLFADEKRFPRLAQPVQMAWDTRGRLWVAVWPNYPSRTPTSKQGDALLVLEDTDGDGRADTCVLFAEDLNCPTGFQFHRDGVLVVQAPDVWFLRDTDGDGRADWRERVLMGIDSADSHHTANTLSLEPGGAIYLSDGVFHRSQVETPSGVVRNIDGAIYRFEPRSGRFERYVAYNFMNPHGRGIDRWGNDLIVDATGNHTYFGPAFSGHLDYPERHPPMKTFWQRPARPSAASTIITSRHLPEEYWGDFLNGNVIGFLGFYRVGVVDDGSGLRGERKPDFLSSSDPNFRPTGLQVGPDGAVYLIDWHNPIIGHMQHHLRDPNRDAVHGRIYRVTHESRPLVRQPRIHGQPIPALLELLKAPENHVRELAKIELCRHPSIDVARALDAWVAGLDPRAPDHAHHLTEALWTYQWHHVVNEPLLRRLLASPDANARAAATRVLAAWRDQVPDALALLRALAGDDAPRVRLQAVRAASFFRSEAAVEVALQALGRPTDYYLDYVLDATLRQLRPHWGKVLSAAGRGANEAARAEFVLRTVSATELLQLPASPAVHAQRVKRPGIPDAARAEALAALAETRRQPAALVLLDLLGSAGEIDAAAMARLLVARPREELTAARARLSALAGDETHPARAYGYAALLMADAALDPAWTAATAAPGGLAPLLDALPLVPDAALRGTALERILPLLPPASGNAPASVVRSGLKAAVSTRREPGRVFAAIAATLTTRDDALVAAVQALRVLPRSAWQPAAAPPLIAAMLRWAAAVPSAQRTERDFLDVLQTAEEITDLLPAEAALARRREIQGLRVPYFVVRAVPEEMRYDTPRIVVPPGRGFQILFENPDFMPHNLVVVRPGSRERVGMAAMLMPPEQRDSSGRTYVPAMPEVLGATRMLEPGQSETLRLVAPKEEGVYEYVCTFPGHWMVMFGQLVVTPDPAAYRPPAASATNAAPAPHGHHSHP